MKVRVYVVGAVMLATYYLVYTTFAPKSQQVFGSSLPSQTTPSSTRSLKTLKPLRQRQYTPKAVDAWSSERIEKMRKVYEGEDNEEEIRKPVTRVPKSYDVVEEPVEITSSPTRATTPTPPTPQTTTVQLPPPNTSTNITLKKRKKFNAPLTRPPQHPIEKLLIASGYDSEIVIERRGYLRVGGYPVVNDLFNIQFTNTTLVQRTHLLLKTLEAPILFRLHNLSLQRLLNRSRRSLNSSVNGTKTAPLPPPPPPPEPSITGSTGRGWGITSAFTNQWRFITNNIVNELNHMSSSRVVLCATSPFTSGHDVAVYTAAMSTLPTTGYVYEYAHVATLNAHNFSQYLNKNSNNVTFGVNVTLKEGRTCFGLRNHAKQYKETKDATLRCTLSILRVTKRPETRHTLCELTQFFKINNRTTIVIDGIDVRRMRDRGSVVVSGSHLRDVQDVIHLLLQEGGLEMKDCMESDVMDVVGLLGICVFTFG
eukprot:PhF_6_TR34959/c0_g1_i3/m.50731